jgi:anti-sigma B factor antagonist
MRVLRFRTIQNLFKDAGRAGGIVYPPSGPLDGAPPMKLIEEVTEDVTILEPFGRLDSTTARELIDRLLALLQAGRSAIVVDLKNIAYITSAGFHALLVANQAAVERQGRLALCGVIGDVKRLFEIGSFTEQFLICQTQADGIGKLKK